MRTFCARSRAYDNDVIQLFWPFADFTQPIKLQKTLVHIGIYNHRHLSKYSLFGLSFHVCPHLLKVELVTHPKRETGGGEFFRLGLFFLPSVVPFL